MINSRISFVDLPELIKLLTWRRSSEVNFAIVFGVAYRSISLVVALDEAEPTEATRTTIAMTVLMLTFLCLSHAIARAELDLTGRMVC